MLNRICLNRCTQLELSIAKHISGSLLSKVLFRGNSDPPLKHFRRHHITIKVRNQLVVELKPRCLQALERIVAGWVLNHLTLMRQIPSSPQPVSEEPDP